MAGVLLFFSVGIMIVSIAMRAMNGDKKRKGYDHAYVNQQKNHPYQNIIDKCSGRCFCHQQNCKKCKEIPSNLFEAGEFKFHSADEFIKHREVIENIGKAIEIIQYHQNNQVEIADITDLDSNLIIRLIFGKDGQLEFVNELNAVGNQTKNLYIDKGEVTWCEEYEFDKHKNITRYTRRGNLPCDHKYSCRYDDHDNLIKETAHKTNDSNKKEVYYSSGSPVKEVNYYNNGSVRSEEYFSIGDPVRITCNYLGSIKLAKPDNGKDPHNLVKVISYDSKGQRMEREYRHEFDSAGNIIKRIELLNGIIEKELTWVYNDTGLPVLKQTAGGEAFISLAENEMGKHSESFKLIGRYSLRGSSTSIITLTESVIKLFISNGYKLVRISCGGMSDYDCAIVSYGKSYTVLEDFVQNAITDHERASNDAGGYTLSFSKTVSYLQKQDNLHACIELDHYEESYDVIIEGVIEETKNINVKFLQSISDTIGLDLVGINVKK